jgi:hypothetical protein
MFLTEQNSNKGLRLKIPRIFRRQRAPQHARQAAGRLVPAKAQPERLVVPQHRRVRAANRVNAAEAAVLQAM